MSQRKGAALLAACAVFAVGGMVRAAEPVTVSQPLYLDPVNPAMAVPPAAAPFAPDSLINLGLDKIGMKKPLDDAGIAIKGYIEGSYTYNTRSPGSDVSEGRVFDFEHDAPRLNQLELSISKAVDTAASVKDHKYQIGFTVDMMYGSDGRLIHANGLNGYKSTTHPINQFDLTQAYVEIALPFLQGLDIKAGKFITNFGNETINPNNNALYSHSYNFGFGIPFTHTGVLATATLNEHWAFNAGFSRGWEQSVKDNNGSIDFLGGATYTMNDEFKVIGNVSVGPQKGKNSSDYRYVFEVLPMYMPKNSPWMFTADALFGVEEHSTASGSAYWYGVTAYAQYKISAMDGMFTPNFRAEWFRDDGGSRLGVDGSFYEFTAGVTIKPFPTHKIGANLSLRPEVRYDYSNKSAFDGGSKHDQFTVAMDAIFNF